jgi:catechol 2,3-dioxygenase-like lactoylglutathione lyase family enzyme
MSNLTYISPSFIVASLKISVAFYVDKLGFEIRYIGPDGDPFWAMLVVMKFLFF